MTSPPIVPPNARLGTEVIRAATSAQKIVVRYWIPVRSVTNGWSLQKVESVNTTGTSRTSTTGQGRASRIRGATATGRNHTA